MLQKNIRRYRNEWLTFHFGVPNRLIHKHSMCRIVPGYTISRPSLLCAIGPSWWRNNIVGGFSTAKQLLKADTYLTFSVKAPPDQRYPPQYFVNNSRNDFQTNSSNKISILQSTGQRSCGSNYSAAVDLLYFLTCVIVFLVQSKANGTLAGPFAVWTQPTVGSFHRVLPDVCTPRHLQRFDVWITENRFYVRYRADRGTDRGHKRYWAGRKI